MNYKEIIKGIINIIESAEQSDIGFIKICNYIGENCPELKESGDKKKGNERILKTLTDYFKNYKTQEEIGIKTFFGIPTDDIIAWLEKQGGKESDIRYKYLDKLLAADDIYQMSMNEAMTNEAKIKAVSALSKMCISELLGFEKQSEQKLANMVEPKFHEGDYVVDNCGNVWKIEGILNQFYLLEGIEGGESRPTIEWVNKTFHLWTIQDAKDGDVLVCEDYGYTTYLLFKSFSDKTIVLHYWYNGQTNNLHNGTEVITREDARIHPATKE